MKIGIFDSGLGGLTILREVTRLLPEYDYIYLGDNARVPYGGRSTDLIYRYTRSAVDFLFSRDCVLVILACNVATASSLKKIQTDYLPQKFPKRRVLGVIRPAVEEAGTIGKRIGILGTYTTVESQSFVRELNKIDPVIQVFQQACPLLVPIIEEGETEWEGLDSILEKYLAVILSHQIDTLILACTHYELIEEKIKERVDSHIAVLSEGKITAQKLKNYLLRHAEIKMLLTKTKLRNYFVTDLNTRYQMLAQRILSASHLRLQLVTLA